ncbi:MAG: hypothetical protein KAI24_20045 [Planctomycetes bacterium]|nr:hypothetical protein [Planctomycetota bacterium]
MRAIYTCYVPLEAEPGVNIMDAIAAKVCRWSGRPDAPDTACEMENRSFVRGGAQECISEGIFAEVDGKRAWSYQFESKDSDDSDLVWVTSVAVDSDQDAARCRFALVLSLADRSGRLRPVFREATRPRIIPELLGEFRCPLGLTAAAHTVRDREEDVDAFLDALTSPARLHPVVVLSVDQWNERPVVQPKKLADRLAGVASVLVVEKHAGMKLDRRVPGRTMPMNGAIRVLWPGWRPSDPPNLHQLFTARDVRERDRQSEGGFVGYILDLLARQTVQANVPDAPSWRRVSALVARQRREQAHRAGSEAELLKLYEDDNEALRGQVEELELTVLERDQEIDRLNKTLASARQVEATWRRAYQDLQSGQSVSEEELPEAPPESLEEACGRAAERYADRLAFKHNSQSDATYGYEYPAEVAIALDWLAGPFYEWKSGRRTGLTFKDMDLELRDACGWNYKTTQSDVTVNKYRNWYTTKLDGRELEVREHIGRGDKKSLGTKSIRIAFCWDDSTQKIVIGFIGQHQRNDQS